MFGVCPRREKGYKERSLCVFVPACRLTCTNGAHSSISVHAGMRGCEGESIRGQKTREHKGSTGSSERETRDRKKALTLFVSLHWLPPVSAPTQQGGIDYKDACDRLCVYEGVFGWISVLKRMFKYMLRTGKGGGLGFVLVYGGVDVQNDYLPLRGCQQGCYVICSRTKALVQHACRH